MFDVVHVFEGLKTCPGTRAIVGTDVASSSTCFLLIATVSSDVEDETTRPAVVEETVDSMGEVVAVLEVPEVFGECAPVRTKDRFVYGPDTGLTDETDRACAHHFQWFRPAIDLFHVNTW